MSNSVNSEQIKTLRDKTGAGIMDCKKALLETEGDIELAVDWLRKKGIASAQKKSSRVASEGLVGFVNEANLCCLIEVNSETDFVSKNIEFQEFVNNLLKVAIKSKMTLAEFMQQKFKDNLTIEDALKNIVAKIGENIVIRRLKYLETNTPSYSFGYYIHNKVTDNLGKIGCMVLANTKTNNTSNNQLSKKIAMHIAASKPIAMDRKDLDQKLINKEKEIFKDQLQNSGKPENIIEKILEGKINKYISEVTLLNQPWIMDPGKNVKNIISDFNNSNNENFVLDSFSLFVLGEGIEIVEKSFKEEVVSQIKEKE